MSNEAMRELSSEGRLMKYLLRHFHRINAGMELRLEEAARSIDAALSSTQEGAGDARLQQIFSRLDAINDNPRIFSPEINDLCAEGMELLAAAPLERSGDGVAAIAAARKMPRRTPAPGAASTEGAGPDFAYNRADWEQTYEWGDRDLVHQEGDLLEPGEVFRVDTLYSGPPKFVVRVPVTPDGDNFCWFDSEEEAKATLASSPTGERGEEISETTTSVRKQPATSTRTGEPDANI